MTCSYRKGLIEKQQMILDYLGEDFLVMEELRTTFSDRYRAKMVAPVIPPHITEAPTLVTLRKLN